jgi:gas vesicle protein
MKMTERIAWLLIGGAVGAGIALLYAPVSGKEARKLIRRKAEDAKDTIVETGEQIRDTVVDAGGQIRDTVVETGESIADAGRSVYRKGASLAAGAAAVVSRRAARG